jgi:predicted GH43/DUF377 family glycosyl hydrolase
LKKLTLLVVVMLVLTFVIMPQTSTAAGWLSGWNYRKSHIINSSAGAGTDYQVRLRLHNVDGTDWQENAYLSGKAESDLSDVRFTSSDGTTKLNYWLEGLELIELTKYSANPILNNTGSQGKSTFASAFKVGDTYHMYFSYDMPSHGITVIGHATSPDGKAWTKDTANNPVLNVSAGQWDSGFVDVPSTWKEGSTWYMLYLGGPPFKIGLATSSDGVTWTKSGFNPVLAGTAGEWDASGIEPWGIIKVSSTYYLWYSIPTYLVERGVGLATSTDLTTWTKDSKNPIFRNMRFCAYSIKTGGYYYAFVPHYTATPDYTQIEVYRDVSPTFYPADRTFIGYALRYSPAGWDSQDIDTPWIMTDDITRSTFTSSDNQLWMYYAGQKGTVWREGLAVNPDISQALNEKSTGAFWVKVSANLSSSNQLIYIYYGNPDASSLSNGDSTFMFHDDFLGNSLNTGKWDKTAGGTITVSNGILTVIGTNTWNQAGIGSKTTFDRSIGRMYEFKWRGRANTGSNHNSLFGYGPFPLNYANGYYFYMSSWGSPNSQWRECVNGAEGYYNSVYVRNTWVDARTFLKASSGYTAWVDSVKEKNATSFSNAGQKVVIQSQQSSEAVDVDWVLVRKYVTSEPAQGSWGSEELFNQPPDTPSVPSGPASGYQNTTYSYASSATDPDNDDVKIKFDYGDATQWESGYVPSGETVSHDHIWNQTGSFCVKVKARDEHGATSGWSACLTVTIANRNPETPSTPTGPSAGYHNVSYGFNSSATDPDNNKVRLRFDWGDSATSDSSFVDSGTNVQLWHSWSSTGTMCVKTRATDILGGQSGWSSCHYIELENRAPNTSSTPSGPTSGYRNVTYDFNSSGTDPDNDWVKLNFSWGDGSNTWTNLAPSGTGLQKVHSWANTGSYCVKTMAMDSYGVASAWSSCHDISIGNQLPNTPSVPSGPTSGYQNTSYTYNSSATDPDNDQVKITVSYGDGNQWESGFVDSGTNVSHSHSWSSVGTFCIKAMATDTTNGTSGWSACRDLTIANRPPDTPSVPIGPTSGYQNTSYTFNSSADDPDDNRVKVKFDYGDGSTWESGFVNPESNISHAHSFASVGSFCEKAKATDALGASSGWSACLTIDITNRPPGNANTPSGPDSGYRMKPYGFNSSATDPDNNQVKIKFDYGDGSTWESGFVDSGAIVSHSHSWSSAGTYCVKAIATDILGATSNWSSCHMITITNRKPDIPSMPTGPSSGYHNVSYAFNSSATDPDDDMIKLTFDWGDGQTDDSEWVDPGANVQMSHAWTGTGTFCVKARATDIVGAQSDWSDCPVDIRNRPPNTPSMPTGPESGYANTSYAYNSSASDPDNDWVMIKFDWGDGSQSQSSWMPSGTNAHLSHNWTIAGTYCIKTIAMDSFGDISGWSSCLMVNIIYSSSDAPPDPSSPDSGYQNAAYTAGSSVVNTNSEQTRIAFDYPDESAWVSGQVDHGRIMGHDHRSSTSMNSFFMKAMAANALEGTLS